MKFSHIALLLVGCAVSAQAFTLPDLTDAHHLVARGFGGGLRDASGAPQKIGTLNKLVSGLLELARGAVRGLAPAIMSLYDTVLPTVRIILAAGDMHVCRPQTSLELLVWDVKEFINNQGRENLGVPVLPLCLPSEEQAPSKEMRERITKSEMADKEFHLNQFSDGTKADDVDFGGDALEGEELDGEPTPGDAEEGHETEEEQAGGEAPPPSGL
jgi:hypothetical protein